MSVGAIQTLRSAGSRAPSEAQEGDHVYGAFVWGNGPPEVPEARRCGTRGRGPAWNRRRYGQPRPGPEASSLIAEFESAATEYGVPQDLLLAMGYVNTMWEMPPPRMTAYREDDIHGRGAYGIMQLVRNPGRIPWVRPRGSPGYPRSSSRTTARPTSVAEQRSWPGFKGKTGQPT